MIMIDDVQNNMQYRGVSISAVWKTYSILPGRMFLIGKMLPFVFTLHNSLHKSTFYSRGFRYSHSLTSQAIAVPLLLTSYAGWIKFFIIV